MVFQPVAHHSLSSPPKEGGHCHPPPQNRSLGKFLCKLFCFLSELPRYSSVHLLIMHLSPFRANKAKMHLGLFMSGSSLFDL